MSAPARNLKETTVVITGASAGVGRAIALRFARAGANLALIARDPAALEEVKQEVEKLGGAALVVRADVADANAMFEACFVRPNDARC
jgi:NADP-dependent 3-hydroxy acid dehydrogenase YdfG